MCKLIHITCFVRPKTSSDINKRKAEILYIWESGDDECLAFLLNKYLKSCK